MALKVAIENAVLRGSRQEQFLQRVATVYVDQTEYYVSAPAKATGNALTWVKHFVVRQPSDSGMGENLVQNGRYSSIVHQVVEELEKHDLESDIWRDVNSSGHYCPAQICLRGHYGEIAKSTGGFFFVWTLWALGGLGDFTFILSARGLWSLRRGQPR
jgi:hypothetical protein